MDQLSHKYSPKCRGLAYKISTKKIRGVIPRTLNAGGTDLQPCSSSPNVEHKSAPMTRGTQWHADLYIKGLELAESVTHGQCDAGPTVTFPAAQQNRRVLTTVLARWRIKEFHVWHLNNVFWLLHIVIYLRRLCRSAWVARSVPSVCLSLCFSAAQLKNEWSQSVQTWYRKWPWDILGVTRSLWVERSNVKVMVRASVGSNSMSAF